VIIVDGAIQKSADLGGRIVDWKESTLFATNPDSISVCSLLPTDAGLLATLGLSNKVLNLGSQKSFAITTNSIAQGVVGSWLVVVGSESISVFNPTNGSKVSTLPTPNATCACIKDDFVYLGTVEKTIRRAQIGNDGQATLTDFELKGNTGSITCIDIDVQNKFLAAGDDQRRIQLYDPSQQSVKLPSLLILDDCNKMVLS
jgi:WD40 repeat protein